MTPPRTLVIESPGNPICKRIKELLREPPHGEVSPTIAIEGGKLIREAVSSGAKIRSVVVCSGAETVWEGCIPTIHVVPKRLMARLSALESPPDAIGIIEVPPSPPLQELLGRSTALVALDGVQDPGNLGTIMRSCEALNASALLLLPGTCSRFNPKVLRAAMGAAFRLPVVEVNTPSELFSDIRIAGFSPLAVTQGGTPLFQTALPDRVALFFGAEGPGLSPEIRARCQGTIGIPMKSGVESLNVATSVAIALYERFRRAPGRGAMT